MHKNKLLEKITPFDIFQHYLPELTWDHIKHKKNVLSRFKEEKNPSMSIYQDTKGILKFKCHTSGNQGDVFEFVANQKGLDCKSQFSQVLKEINQDIGLGLGQGDTYQSPDWKAAYYKDFTNPALAFWENRKIDQKTLSKYGVRQIKKLTYKGKKQFNYEERGLIAFEFTVNGRKKLYVPKQEDLDRKYLCKTQVNTDIFGLAQLSKNKLKYLLICEGEPDTLCAAAHQIAAVCFQSASTMPTRTQIRQLRRHASHLVLIYDNDETGRKNAQKIAQKYNLIDFKISDEYNDLSEYLPNANRSDFLELIDNEIDEFRRKSDLHIWEYDYAYWKDGKAITNFIVEVEAMIVQEESSRRLVRFFSKEFDTGIVSVDSKIFNSEQKFEDFVSDLKGNFQSTATKKDMQAIRKMTFDLCDYYEEAEILGYSQKYEGFIFSNAVIKDGKVLLPDDRGIIHKLDLYIASAAIENRDNSSYESIRKIRFANYSRLKTPWSFFKILVENYGPTRSIIGFSYLLASLFFDYIARIGNGGFFPLLGVSGQRGSGKGSFTKMLLSLFTDSPEETSLQNVTKVGMMRRYEQSANIPVWLDEYKNSLPETIIEGLKNIFDLIGKVSGIKSIDARTTRSRVLSPTILTGQESPTNEALFSRCVSIHFPPVVKDKERIRRHLEQMNELHKGCGDILIQLLSYRNLIILNYKTAFYGLIDQFSDLVADKGVLVNTRLIKNYASIFAPAVIAIENGLQLWAPDDQTGSKDKLKQLFVDVAKKNLLEQAADEQQLDEVNQFLDLLVVLADKRELKIDYDFLIDKSKNEFVVKSVILKQFNKYYYQVYSSHGPDWHAIDKYLPSKPYFKQRRRSYFKDSSNDGKKSKQLWGLVFHFSELNEEQQSFFLSLHHEEDQDHGTQVF